MHLKTIVSEIQVLRKLQSVPNNIYTTKLRDLIVPEVEDSEPIPYVFIIMDYYPMDLRGVLSNSNMVGLTEQHIVTIMYNALRAMEFFHSTGLMHRDIKPSNFLIDHECQVKLCDFGCTRPILSKLP